MARRKSTKPKKVKTIHELRIACLRRASYRWVYKYEALKAAKVVVPDGCYLNGNPRTKTLFRCAFCLNLFPQKQVQVDHRIPIVSVKEGFEDWNAYIPALLCHQNNLQVLCKPHHKEKSALEMGERAVNRKKRKSNKKA